MVCYGIFWSGQLNTSDPCRISLISGETSKLTARNYDAVKKFPQNFKNQWGHICVWENQVDSLFYFVQKNPWSIMIYILLHFFQHKELQSELCKWRTSGNITSMMKNTQAFVHYATIFWKDCLDILEQQLRTRSEVLCTRSEIASIIINKSFQVYMYCTALY